MPSVEAGAGEADTDVTAELEGELLSGVNEASFDFLKIFNNEILPRTRDDGSASVPADRGLEDVEILEGRLDRVEDDEARGTSRTCGSDGRRGGKSSITASLVE